MLSLHFSTDAAHTNIASFQHILPVLFLSSIISCSVSSFVYPFRTQYIQVVYRYRGHKTKNSSWQARSSQRRQLPTSRCIVSLSIAINPEIQSLEDHSTRLPSFHSSISSHRSWKHHFASPTLPSRALYHQRAIASPSRTLVICDNRICALDAA
jgi:hypothetical protein